MVKHFYFDSQKTKFIPIQFISQIDIYFYLKPSKFQLITLINNVLTDIFSEAIPAFRYKLLLKNLFF
jgi:hypothetical protein